MIYITVCFVFLLTLLRCVQGPTGIDPVQALSLKKSENESPKKKARENTWLPKGNLNTLDTDTRLGKDETIDPPALMAHDATFQRDV